MKFLITGGAGLLGSELVKQISHYGQEVIVLDLPHARWETVRDIEGVESVYGDITDPFQIHEICEGVDGVFHLAAILPPRSESDRDLTFRVNVDGTKNLVEALYKRSGVPMILASSISTYGITAKEDSCIMESHTLEGHNVYSKSKIQSERLLKKSGVPYVILRIAPLAVADLVELPDTIPYKADQRVEFVYVADAARALLSAAKTPEAFGGVFNIAGGASWQMTGSEYVEAFYDALGVEVEPHFSEEYTALDWYDTSRSAILDYQRVTLDKFLEKLQRIAIELGLI